MKKIVYTLLPCLCAPLASLCQQDPVFSLYRSHYLYYNPAYAGAEDSFAAAATVRSEAVHFKDYEVRDAKDAHNTIGLLTGAAALEKLHSGVGIVALHQHAGLAKSSSIGAAYNYKFRITEKAALRVGAQLTYLRHEVDYSKYSPEGIDAFPLMLKITHQLTDVHAGAWYSSARFYAGLSLHNIFAPALDYVWYTTRLPRILYTTAGYQLPLSPVWSVTASFLNRTSAYSDWQTSNQCDANVMLTYARTVSVGAGWRTVDFRGVYEQAPLLLSAGISVKDRVQLLAAADLNMQREYRNDYGPSFEGSVRVKF